MPKNLPPVKLTDLVYVVEGRGKTGEAKRGKLRFLFLNDGDQHNFERFIRECWSWVCENFDKATPAKDKNGNDITEPIPYKDYLETSRNNLLKKQTLQGPDAVHPGHLIDVCHYTSKIGTQIVMINTTTWASKPGGVPDHARMLRILEDVELQQLEKEFDVTD